MTSAPLLALERRRQGLPPRPARPHADVLARRRLHAFARARDRRRDGPERLRQDHAVRADHRQQPCRSAGRVVVRAARTSNACAIASATGSRSTITSPTRCAASASTGRSFLLERARQRIPAGAPVRRAAVQHPGRLHRLHAGLLPQAARRGAAGVRLPASERAATTSTSCARSASASCSSAAAGLPSMPITPAWWPARTSAAIWACWLRAEHLPPAALETPNSRCRAPQAGRLVERAYRLTAYCRVLGGRNGANA